MVSSPRIDQGEGLIRTYDLLEHLIDDVYKSFEVLDSDKESQYLRRVVVRNVFSFVEGIVQILKHEIRTDLRLMHYDYELSSKEKVILFEEKEKDGGKFSVFIPMEQNIKKTFGLASKVWGLSEFRFKSDGQEYRWFMKAKEARNRLTHPRTYYDINITDLEIGYFSHTFEWVRSEFQFLFREKVKYISEALPLEIAGRFKNA